MAARKPIVIRKERIYPHPPEDVWAAITDPRALAEWLEPNDHRAVVGHKFQFRCDPGVCGSGITECEVLEADPPRKLVWSWVSVPTRADQPRPPAMTITWTLTPRDNGTLLVLEQSGAEYIGWLTRFMMRIGWGVMMKKLIPKILSHTRGGTFQPGAIPINKRYYTCKTIPQSYVR